HRVELAPNEHGGAAVIALLAIVHERDACVTVRRVYGAQHLEVALGLAPGVELDSAEPLCAHLRDELDIGLRVREHRRRGVREKALACATEQAIQRQSAPLR